MATGLSGVNLANAQCLVVKARRHVFEHVTIHLQRMEDATVLGRVKTFALVTIFHAQVIVWSCPLLNKFSPVELISVLKHDPAFREVRVVSDRIDVCFEPWLKYRCISGDVLHSRRNVIDNEHFSCFLDT